MTAKLESVSSKRLSPVAPSSALPVRPLSPPSLRPLSTPSLPRPLSSSATLQTKPAETAKYTLPPGFTTENIQVGSEWMNRAAYNALSTEDQNLIRQMGVTAFNTYQRTRYNDSQAALEAAFYYRDLTGGTTGLDLVGFVNNERGTWYFKDGYIWIKPILPTLFPKPDYKTSYKTVEEMLAGLGYADKDIQDIVAFNKNYVNVPSLGGYVERSYWDKLSKEEQSRINAGTVVGPANWTAAGVAAGQLMSYNVAGGMSKLAADVQAGLTTIKTASQNLGVSEAQLSTLVLLETKYKTGDGYRLAEALTDPLVKKHETELIDLFGADVVADAKRVAVILERIGDKEIKDVVQSGQVSAEDLVLLQAFSDLNGAERYVEIVQTLSKVEGTKYEDAEGFDLVGIIQDKKLSPGEVQLVFGPQPEDSAEVSSDKAKVLAQAREIAHANIKTPAGLSQSIWWGITPWKEERGRSFNTYVLDADGNKNYLKAVAAGELIAAQTIGPFLLALVPGGIVGTGAAIGGRAVATAATLSRVASAGISVGFAGMGAYGAYETVQHWNEMSLAQQTFNLTMSFLAMLPMLHGGYRAVNNARVGTYRLNAKAIKAALAEPIPSAKRPALNVKGQRAIGGKVKGESVQLTKMRTQFLRDMFRGQNTVTLGEAFRNLENGLGRRSYRIASQTFGKAVAQELDKLYRTYNELLDAYVERGVIKANMAKRGKSYLRALGEGDVGAVDQLIGKVRLKQLRGASQRLSALDTKIRTLSERLNAMDDALQEKFRKPSIFREIGKGEETSIDPQRLSPRTFGKRDMAASVKALGEAITGESKINLEALAGEIKSLNERIAFYAKQGKPVADLLREVDEKTALYQSAKMGNIAKMRAMYEELMEVLDTIYEGKMPQGAVSSKMELWPLIEEMKAKGLSTEAIMKELSKRKVITPSRYAFLKNGVRITEPQIARLIVVAQDMGKQLVQVLEHEVKRSEPLTGKILETRGEGSWLQPPKTRQVLVWKGGKYQSATSPLKGQGEYARVVERQAVKPMSGSGGSGRVGGVLAPTETAPSTSLLNLTRLKPKQAPVFAYSPGAGLGVIRSPEFEKRVKPLVYDDVKRMVNPGEINQTANLLMNAVEVGMRMELASAPVVERANAIETALVQELATSPALSTELKLKLQTKLKVLVKTAIKVATKVKPKPKWFPPILPPQKGATTSEAELEIPPGAAGWKQGAVYWHIWPENNELKKKATRKPVEGIPYKEGIGSAYASLRKTHGELPKLMGMDMGIMDVYIQGDQREPKMKVRQDLQRRTRLNLVEGNPSISRMK